MSHVGIVGGGASGLICAIELARLGHQVSVFEHNAKLGRKILATGNGKCNISNNLIHISHYHGESIWRIEGILKHFDSQKCQDYFRRLGLEMVENSEGRCYPMSYQAASVVDILVHEARLLGVTFFLETTILQIEKQAKIFHLMTDTKNYEVDLCVVATGSIAMPKLGSLGSGYTFAKTFGHRVIEPFASLVQLVSKEPFLELTSGVRMDAIVKLYENAHVLQVSKGDVLFTPYGLSGDAILQISRKASVVLSMYHSVEVSLDVMPHITQEALQGLLQKRLAYAKAKSLLLWLEGMIPKKLALFILKKERLDAMQEASTLGIKEIKKIVFALKQMRLKIDSTKGFESAEVCAGGIDLCEVDEQTLMSKKVENLYFCGEVLDVDGDCGGFNLHFAWASGFCVGKNIGKNNLSIEKKI